MSVKNFFVKLQGKVDEYNRKNEVMEERLSYSGMKFHCLKWTMNTKKRNHQQSERSENPLRSH